MHAVAGTLDSTYWWPNLAIACFPLDAKETAPEQKLKKDACVHFIVWLVNVKF